MSCAKLRAGLALSSVAVLLLGAACKRNHPPTTPDVTGLHAYRPGDTTQLSAISTDQDDDLVSYLLAWGDTSSAVWSSDYPSGVSVTRSHAYAESGTYAVRARARDDKGAESDWSPTETLRVGLWPPGTPVRPAGPAAWEWGAVYACSTSATSPYGESLFIQFDWGGSLGDWGEQVASDSFRLATYAFDSAGLYVVRARSRDKAGLISVWSDSLSVAVGSSSNRPPYMPQAPTGPVNCVPNEIYTYAVKATDPNDDSVAVRVDWGDSAISDWTDWSNSGSEITLSHAWADTGAFQIKAQARDPELLESDWSGALSVQVLRRPDVPAIPIGPVLCFKDTTYTFKSVTTDRFGDSVSIRFDWGSDTSDWSPFIASGETVAMSYAWPDVGHNEVTEIGRASCRERV